MLILRPVIPMVVFGALGSACHWQEGQIKGGATLNILHRYDPSFAGVAIYQNDLVNMDEEPPRANKDHPYSIVYYFWDGLRVHDVTYDKNGQVVRDIWRDRFTQISKDEWSRVDFSYGSDPAFKFHEDPRKQ